MTFKIIIIRVNKFIINDKFKLDNSVNIEMFNNMKTFSH